MIRENIFDEVHDCQEAFRSILYAISNPGSIRSISAQAGKLQTGDSAILAVALTLLDKETSFGVADNEALSQTISDLTYSKKIDLNLCKADIKSSERSPGFIFVTGECGPGEIEGVFQSASPGTLLEPHTNSTLVIGVDAFQKNATCRLEGPGIMDSAAVGLTEYAKAWVRQRDKMDYEFPTGIDIYFVAPSGEILVLPRKVKMIGG